MMPMRVPTPDPYAWHRRALADPRTTRHEDDPQPGTYVRRAVKNGPLIPVEIRLVQEIDEETGELTAPEEMIADELGWSKDPRSIWLHLRPVSRDEFDALVERHRTDERMMATHAPLDIAATPTRPTRGKAYA